ncbi:MAG: cell division protein FtsW [Alphaproteobacteria bacterium]|nr:MAG: cell division protein FtsW [Alphaproteobacteria bacterium]
MFTRSDTSLLARWWWTIDRWLLFQIFLLMFIGIILVVTASPSVAKKIDVESLYFAKRHLAYMILGSAALVGASLLKPEQIRIFAAGLFVLMVVGMLLTFFSVSIKGARRWINLWGFSLQPSEFLKPAFVILTAWLFAEQANDRTFPGQRIAMGVLIFNLILLLCQPDVGTSVLMAATFTGQFILAGLSLVWILYVFLLGGASLVGAYFFFPHVAQRIDRFLFATNVDKYAEGYQIHQSLESFANGGWLGMGPGEGIIKKHLPDAHADFIFSVASEEFGLVFCIVVIAIFTSIVWQISSRALQESSYFHVYATIGLVIQFSLQTTINIASSVHLIPTKGMTLPLISYGGSSIIATCMALGFILSFNRRVVIGGRHVR